MHRFPDLPPNEPPNEIGSCSSVPDRTPIRITADTSEFDAAMRDMSVGAEQFGNLLSGALRQAVVSGNDLDDTLRRIVLRLADGPAGRALAPLESALGSALGALVSGARPATSGSNITLNVNAQDAASFRKSEGQLSAMLARLVARGGRSI